MRCDKGYLAASQNDFDDISTLHDCSLYNYKVINIIQSQTNSECAYRRVAVYGCCQTDEMDKSGRRETKE
jgi:hypothetical protein